MTDDNPPTTPLPPAGWYRDPMGQGDARYWDGAAWTDSVSRGSVTFQAAVPPDQLRVPPVPGSEYHTPPPAPQPVAAQPAPQVYAEPPPRSGGSGALVGIIAAAAAVLIVVVILVWVFGGDDSDDEPPTTDVPAEITNPPDGGDGEDGGDGGNGSDTDGDNGG